ncbi:MAG: CDP-alcohol phosphatidyltransferase family protein [Nitrospinaceae bacterium]|nr:CDP-alcohol phosphatidyltransferase family protein [Nitrospinaceae bacterium]
MAFDIEKMNKLPREARFFDVNGLWYFYNGSVVRMLYSTPITPNQITVLSFFVGLLSVGFYVSGRSDSLLWGALFLYGKVLLDNIDGNLARIRGTSSRLGRFLDSLTDFLVTVMVYIGISFYLVQTTGDNGFWFLGLFGLLACFMQSTFFVFYLVSYTSRVGSYDKNRVDESITEEDLASAEQNQWNLRLQKIFTWSYGWQDRLIERLDFVSRKLAGVPEKEETAWYGDRCFLTAISPLCLCTNNVMLVIFSLVGQVELFLILLISLMNFYGIGLLIWKIQKWKIKNDI